MGLITICGIFFCLLLLNRQYNSIFFAMSRVNELLFVGIVLDIDRNYTMTWFPVSLLIMEALLDIISCCTLVRRPYVTMADMRHSLAILNFQ